MMDIENTELNIQWFPGHMAKTRRLISENLRLVDAVIEVTDARIPHSSRNPEIARLIGSKPVLLLLNKCDTADDAATSRWLDFYRNSGVPALATDCISGKNTNRILPAVRDILREDISRWEQRGMVGRSVRLMIVGIPNVGKSALINCLAGSKRAKVEDRPGVTRAKQWIRLSEGCELLDTPGVLAPKFDDRRTGLSLAFTGAVRDDILDTETLALMLVSELRKISPDSLEKRYGVRIEPEMTDLEAFEAIGKKRGFLISGGEINYERTAAVLLDEFRSQKLGRITLELPEDKP